MIASRFVVQTVRACLVRNQPQYKLDVVFVGDSITEQRQGTSMSKPNDNYIGIKEVFDKTFTREKGGDFNGLAMGISADTVRECAFHPFY